MKTRYRKKKGKKQKLKKINKKENKIACFILSI